MKPLFDAVMQRLSTQDQDQEVKECAILCMAAMVAALGDQLAQEVRGRGTIMGRRGGVAGAAGTGGAVCGGTAFLFLFLFLLLLL